VVDGVCTEAGCSKAVYCRGWCQAHYMRWYRKGSVARPSVVDRFLGLVDITSGCWGWTGAKTKAENGYGQFRGGEGQGRRRKRVVAHRFAYELAVGPVPHGLVLDHVCRNRLCVNPDHLEPVTMRENTARGVLSRQTA